MSRIISNTVTTSDITTNNLFTDTVYTSGQIAANSSSAILAQRGAFQNKFVEISSANLINAPYKFVYGNSIIVGVVSANVGNSAFVRSTDKGLTWSSYTVSEGSLNNIEYVNNKFIALGVFNNYPSVYESTDQGISFTRKYTDTSSTNAYFDKITYATGFGGKYGMLRNETNQSPYNVNLATAGNGQILFSTNLTSWTTFYNSVNNTPDGGDPATEFVSFRELKAHDGFVGLFARSNTSSNTLHIMNIPYVTYNLGPVSDFTDFSNAQVTTLNDFNFKQTMLSVDSEYFCFTVDLNSNDLWFVDNNGGFDYFGFYAYQSPTLLYAGFLFYGDGGNGAIDRIYYSSNNTTQGKIIAANLSNNEFAYTFNENYDTIYKIYSPNWNKTIVNPNSFIQTSDFILCQGVQAPSGTTYAVLRSDKSLILANTGNFTYSIYGSNSITINFANTLSNVYANTVLNTSGLFITNGTLSLYSDLNELGIYYSNVSTIAPEKTLDYQVFTANGTWAKPSWATANDLVTIMLWGGGGGANNASATGGGGAFVFVNKLAGECNAICNVVVGRGGNGGTSVAATAGGNSIFYSNSSFSITAYGGGYGTSTSGGAGGGWFSMGGSGVTSQGATGGGPLGGANAALGGTSTFGGGGGSAGAGNGGISVYGGGGGGVTGAGVGFGGNSMYGGAGGSGGAAIAISTFGGNGGNNTTTPSAPGGGGGGGAGANAAGARGEVRIWVQRQGV